MLKRSDVEAYLGVLGYPTAGTTKENMIGCLVRLEEQLEPLRNRRPAYLHPEWRALYHLIMYRETLTGFLPNDHPTLRSATKLLAGELSALLEKKDAVC